MSDPVVLILDRESHVQNLLCQVFETHSFHACGAASSTEAFALLEKFRFDFALFDIESTGHFLISLASKHLLPGRLALMSASNSGDVASEYGCRYLQKVFSPSAAVKLAIELRKSRLSKDSDGNLQFAPKSIAEVVRETIIQTLAFTEGDRDRAARLLMIGRTTLYRKMRDFEIQDDDWRLAKASPISLPDSPSRRIPHKVTSIHRTRAG